METAHARAIAERLHLGDREEDGTPVIRHVRRVATTVPEEARAVAWLHEVLEWTAVTEQELLLAGLTSDELRALRLLNRTTDSHSDRRYLAHLELIAHATGDSGRLARIVKTADLKDRSPPSTRPPRRLVATLCASAETARGGARWPAPRRNHRCARRRRVRQTAQATADRRSPGHRACPARPRMIDAARQEGDRRHGVSGRLPVPRHSLDHARVLRMGDLVLAPDRRVRGSLRRHDISGWGKAGWIVLLVFLPYLGVFIYLIAQGAHMAERKGEETRARRAGSMTTSRPSPLPAAQPPRSRRPSSCSTAAPSRNPSSTRSRNGRSPSRDRGTDRRAFHRRKREHAAVAPAGGGDVRARRRHVADERVDLGGGQGSRHDGQLCPERDRARGPGLRCVHPDQQQGRRPLRTQAGVRAGSAGVCDRRAGDDPRPEPDGDHRLLGDHRRPRRLAPAAGDAVPDPWQLRGSGTEEDLCAHRSGGRDRRRGRAAARRLRHHLPVLARRLPARGRRHRGRAVADRAPQGRPVHGSAAGRRGRRGPVRAGDGRRGAGHPGVAGGRRLRRAADRDRRARALGARPLARAAPSRGQGDAARSGPVPAPALQDRDLRADAAEHHARRGDDRAADLPADQARIRRPGDGPVARPALTDHVRRRDPRRTEVRRPPPRQDHPDRVRAEHAGHGADHPDRARGGLRLVPPRSRW